MKTIFKTLVICAASTAVFASCQKENTANQINTINISVETVVDDFANAAPTKTYINSDNQILWGANEQMTIALTSESSAKFATSAYNTECVDQEKATFDFTIEATNTPCVYGGLYPASFAVSSSNTDATKYKVQLPDTQYATATSYDPKAYLLIAKPEDFATAQTEWLAYFRRGTALNKLTLTGINDDIISVVITAPEGKVLAGRRYIDLTTAESGEIYSNETNSITVNYREALPAAADKTVWFTTWETELTAGEELTIKASSLTKSYTRTITAKEAGIKFLEGYLNLTTVNMAAEDVIVDDNSNYEGNYIIVSYGFDSKTGKPAGNWGAMTGELSTTSTKYYKFFKTSVAATDEVDLTASDKTFMEVTDSWIVEKIEGTANYAIKNAKTGKYINWTTGNSGAASDTQYALTISEDDTNEGRVKITSVADPTRVLQYNSNSGQERYAFYAGTQNNVYLVPFVQPKEYKINIETVEGGSFSAPEKAAAGAAITITATPADGYEFTSVTVTDATGAEVTVEDLTFTMPASDVTITGVFSKSQDDGYTWPNPVTFNFGDLLSLDEWASSYAAHTVEYKECTVTFASANKQANTITDAPVTKGQPVTVVMKGGKTIKNLELVCKKWAAKAQTITLNISKDGGETFTATDITSSDFDLIANSLEEGVNAVKFTFSSSSNQIGIYSLKIEYK